MHITHTHTPANAKKQNKWIMKYFYMCVCVVWIAFFQCFSQQFFKLIGITFKINLWWWNFMDACTNSIRIFFNEKYGNFTYLCLEKIKKNKLQNRRGWKTHGSTPTFVYYVYHFFRFQVSYSFTSFVLCTRSNKKTSQLLL